MKYHEKKCTMLKSHFHQNQTEIIIHTQIDNKPTFYSYLATKAKILITTIKIEKKKKKNKSVIWP